MRKFKQISSFIFISLSLLLISLLAKIDKDTLFFLCSTFVGFIKILGFLIIPLSKYVSINKEYVYLGLYIGGCGIFRITISILKSVGIGIDVPKMLFWGFMLSIMEIIAIYHVISNKDRNLENKKIIIDVFWFITVFIFISSAFITMPFLTNNFNIKGLDVVLIALSIIYDFRIVLQALIVILFISLIIALNLYCKNVNDIPIKNDIIVYIIIRIIHSSLYLVGFKTGILFYLNIISIFLTGFYIGKIFFTCIIKNPNETFFNNLEIKNRALEEALKELEVYSELIKDENDHINNIINSFPEAVVLFENGKITFVNTRFREIFQCSNNEKLLGSTFTDFIREDYHQQFYSRKEQLNPDNRCGEIEYVLEFNGVEFIGEIVSSKIKKGDKYITVSVIRDITKKKIIEHLNKTLEYKEKESKLKSELLTNMSHEFKTPVHVIYSAIQMQDVYSENNDIKNIMKFNHVIKQNCFRLIRLINNFIDITKFEANVEIKSNIKPLNAVLLVESTVESVISYCTDNHISIIFDTDNEEIYGEFDAEMLDRIMLNLLSNAIKYNKDNGDIFVTIKETETNIIINVKDTGVGISNDDLSKLFHRFERLDKSLSRKREGTGIGLNIVKSLVEYQNGEIKVTSEVGKGTTFSLIFPKIGTPLESLSHYSGIKEELINRVSLELSDII